MSEAGNLPLFLRALAFAAAKHRDQRRKDAAASPYINHPIALASVLVREGGVSDPDVLAAALLHDTVEDTQTTPAELEAAFGPAIARVVAEVTDDKSLPKVERKRLQVEARRGDEPRGEAGEARRQDLQPVATWPTIRRRSGTSRAGASTSRGRRR